MRSLRTGLAAVSLVVMASSGWGQEAAPGTLILDQFSSWRMFNVLKAPEIAFEDGPKAVFYVDKEHYFCNGETASPPTDWKKPDFDDSEWLRGPVKMGCHTPFVQRAYFRGKFEVTDPGQVKSLRVTVGYHGGVVVYLNGEEAGRKDVAAGAGLAEAYPLEAFVGADGSMLGTPGQHRDSGKRPDEEAVRRMGLRERTVEVVLPVKLLRKGINVLGLEVVRSPYHKVIDDQKKINWNKEPLLNMFWNTCELEEVRLTTGAGGVKANLAWPAGLHVWNSSALRTDFTLDSTDACERVRPMTLVGTRNGIFSDKVVVGSDKAIRGLKAVPSDLVCAGGTIPASAVRVRYAVEGGAEYGIYAHTFGVGSETARTQARAAAMNVLMDAAPAEYAPAGGAAAASEGEAKPRPGTVAPIWVTVKVPANAKAGTYKGKLAVSSEGQNAVVVPVELKVADWTLPDPDRFQSWTEMMESPDTLQLEYGVPAWSQKHFDLIARSFRHMREVGSKVVYIPLICCTNFGNEESMVRWVKKDLTNYDFDFTVMDKYLDVAQKNLGQPQVVCFIVWEVFMLPSKELSVGGAHSDIPGTISRMKERMSAPWVTTVDPATGKLDRVEFASYFNDPGSKTQWEKLFAQLRERMKKRGLEDKMMLGWFTDVRAQKDELMFWRDVTGDLPWVSHAHWRLSTRGGGLIKTGYNTSIHDTHYPEDPAKGRTYGWKHEGVIHAQQLLRPGWRGEMDMLPGSMWSSMEELTIAGGQRGFGRLGGDSWYVLRDKNGKRTGRVYERYPWSIWDNLELCCSLLAPGPDGAVTTARFEQVREGVQESEARIFIEQALTDAGKREKLGEELAERCQTALDERILYGLRGASNFQVGAHEYVSPWKWIFQNGAAGHAWFQSSGWRERDEKLFELAGEVARKVGTN